MSPIGTLCFLLLLIHSGGEGRLLYESISDGQKAQRVLTYSRITDPVGLVVGDYEGVRGLFVSSFQTHSISFVSLEHGGHTRSVEAEVVVGGTYGVDYDGSFGEASLAEPSRMSFDSQCQILFVACKKNRVIRALDFNSRRVSTLQRKGGDKLTFSRHDQYQHDIPGFDVQSIEGDSIFISDLFSLTRVIVDEAPYCEHIVEEAVIVEYHSLTFYMNLNDYPSNAVIHSILPDITRECIYVAISVGVNVVLKVPLSASYNNQYTEIEKLVGNDKVKWNGVTTSQLPPVAQNGNVHSKNDNVTLAFPMHLQYDSRHNYLLWTECFPYVDDYFLGSLTVRRMSMSTGDVDFFAGYNFCQDTDTYQLIGTHGGYRDSTVDFASFGYPVSIAFHADDVSAASGSGSMYVADKANNAIRRVAVVIDTSAPTSVFLPSAAPSRSPTLRPTVSSEPTATYYPTYPPTVHPSYSFTPTYSPTKRPTRRPTPPPTTPAPTSSQVWIQDKSIFNTIGLGTVHVKARMYLISALIGVVLSILFSIAYIYRKVSPERELRTAAEFRRRDGCLEQIGRKVHRSGQYVVYFLGVLIPGSAFYRNISESNSKTDDNSGLDSEKTGSESGWLRSFFSSACSGDDHAGHTTRRDSSVLVDPGLNKTNVRSILESVRKETDSTRISSLFQSSRAEYREVAPGDVDMCSIDSSFRSNLDLDDSARSTAPMLTRTMGCSDDGL